MANYKRLLGILVCVLFMSISLSWNIDFPQAFEDPMISKFGVTTTEIQSLYSIYCFVNAAFAVPSGLMINRLGYGLSATLLGALSFIGAFIIYNGFETDTFGYVMGGRAIYSFGAEASWIISIAIIDERFVGSFATVAMTINYVIARVFSACGNILMPELFLKTRNIKWPFFFETIIGFVQVLFSVYFIVAYEKKTKEEKEAFETSIIIEDGEQLFTWSHLKTLNPLFWACLGCYAFVAATMYTLTNTITDLIMVRYRYQYQDAKNFLGIIQIVQVILMVPIATLMQKIGYKTIFMSIGSFISVVCIGALIYIDPEPSWKVMAVFILFAVYFSLYGPAIFPCMTMSIAKDSVSIGLSLATVIQQLTLSLTPIPVGYLAKDRTPQAYQNCLYFIFIIGIIGFIFSLLVIFLDFKYYNSILHLPENCEDVAQLRKQKTKEYQLISKTVSLNKSIGRRAKNTGIITVNSDQVVYNDNSEGLLMAGGLSKKLGMNGNNVRDEVDFDNYEETGDSNDE